MPGTTKRIGGYSLKNRVTAAFLASSILTFLLVSSASFYTIYSILYNKIDRSIDMTLSQLVKDLDLTMDNLRSVSEQLSYGGMITDDLAVYLTSESYSERVEHSDILEESLYLIDHTNPDVGLHFYFYHKTDSKREEKLFANDFTNREFRPADLPLLAGHAVFRFHGPHVSYTSPGELVMSVIRPVDFSGGVKLNVYIETKGDTLRNILQPNRLGVAASYVLVGPEGRIAYSELPDTFPEGSLIGETRDGGGYKYYEGAGKYGWRLIAAVDSGGFYKEIRHWGLQMAAIGVGLMLISLLLGFMIWRSVYEPIRVFRRAIERMAESNFDPEPERTRIAEFDQTLKKFDWMKERIQALLGEVKMKERDKRQLEVDKLLAQINPHFLYNTLNTMQWIARSEGQNTIVRMITSLIRLLRYNLGKEGFTVTLEQEISALKDYVALQLVRNDYQFKVDFDIDEAANAKLIPRFILQPLVENAIYHGLREGKGTIRVVVALDRGTEELAVTVADDGPGLSEEARLRLIEEQTEGGGKYGLGIGLTYVNKMLEVYCGEGYALDVDSRAEEGTVYRFRIKTSGGNSHAKGTDR